MNKYKTLDDCTYYLIPWDQWIKMHPYDKISEDKLSLKGECVICSSERVGYIVTLSDGFNTYGASDICSESCFNMWLLRK